MSRRQSPPLKRRVYSVAEAAEQLGVSRATGYRIVESGELRSVRVRSRIVVPVEAIDEFLSRFARAS